MRRWSKESIEAALQRFKAIYGESPRMLDLTMIDWLPTAATIRDHYGSVRAGYEAAGIQIRPRGYCGHLNAPPRCRLTTF